MAHRIELRSRPDQHFVYSGRSVLVVDLDGCITGGGMQGFFVDNTRLLSRFEVSLDGERLKAFAASPVRGDGFLSYADVPRRADLPEHSVFLETSHFVGEGLRSELCVVSYAWQTGTINAELAVDLAADFADHEETRTGDRQQDGPIESDWDPDLGELTFRYCHPRLERAVAIRVERAPSPVRLDDGRLVVRVELRPHVPVELVLSTEPILDGRRTRVEPRTFASVVTPLATVRRRLRHEAPQLTTTNATVARAWETAIEDLASLPLGLDDAPATPIAGLPLYQQFFGRDSLTIAWQALLAMPLMMRDTLRANAAWRGRVIDDWLDEEPGKMIHQARWGPLSALGINPFGRYYGDYATVPDFLVMLGQYLSWTNDVQTVRSLLPAARDALSWLERYADIDRDGFIEYVTRSEGGVKHQGWKDSNDAVVDEEGGLVEPPIASSELQAYWYAALGQAAFCFLRAGDAGYALELRQKADALKRRFDQAFWMEDAGFYAMALGPDKRQVRSISSNTGHLLAAGIVPRDKAPRVARRLLAPDLFSGWGVRTLSSDNPPTTRSATTAEASGRWRTAPSPSASPATGAGRNWRCSRGRSSI
ncbi:MAG: hypothetical protein M3301_02345 [Chloroflexota bacterium]|nr:hypothetical protein [Chloroflexota bacterium]